MPFAGGVGLFFSFSSSAPTPILASNPSLMMLHSKQAQLQLHVPVVLCKHVLLGIVFFFFFLPVELRQVLSI